MKYLNRIIYILVFIFSFIVLSNNVYADYQAQVIKAPKCKLYDDKTGKKSTGTCIYKDGNFNAWVTPALWVDIGDKVTVYTSKDEIKAPTTGYGSECPSSFVYINVSYQGNNKGYVCKDFIWDGIVSDEMKEKFKANGFYDETYYKSLATLSIAHPNWIFKAVDTEINFNTAVANEEEGRRSLIQGDQGYFSTKDMHYNYYTDSFTSYSGTTWFAANSETIAYYMDPRNFLSDNHIWQFESLYFEANDTTKDQIINSINSILSGHYISKFATEFYNAGVTSKVSPVYLASLSKQEVGGVGANVAISGAQVTYGGKTYKGLYNFYNIGATSDSDGLDALRGIVYANGGSDGMITSYNRPWNTETKSILGGAQFIYNQYVNKGQFTSYFKKFNTVYNYAKKNGFDPYVLYANQYMQNVKAPMTEAYSAFKSYNEQGILNYAYTFYIPVYRDMPASTKLPKTGNPNNYLKSFTYILNDGNVNSVLGFDGSKTEYEMHVKNYESSIILNGETINKNARVSGLGTKNLNIGDNKISIVVTAQNGSVKTYNINIIRDEITAEMQTEYKKLDEIISNIKIKNDDTYLSGFTLDTKITDFKANILKFESKANIIVKRNGAVTNDANELRTGDIVTITSGSESQSYSIVIYGDISSDGKINIFDLVKIQKHILKTGVLNGVYAKSADVNKDGKIDIFDLVKVQKYILKTGTISQN